MSRKIYRYVCGSLIAVSLAVGFFVFWDNTSGPYIIKSIRFFSYFTHISNIFVMLWYFLSASRDRPGAFYNRRDVRGAVMTYILVTGIIFFTALLPQMSVQGLPLVNGFILHGLSPLLFYLDYILFDEKGSFTWISILRWLYLPVFYLIWTLVLSIFTGSAPYPFIDLRLIGLKRLLLWTLLFLIIFAAASAFTIALDKLCGVIEERRQRPRAAPTSAGQSADLSRPER